MSNHLAVETTTTGNRGPGRRGFLSASEFMAADARARRREGADARDVVEETRASVAGAQKIAMMRLFHGYTD